MNGVAGQIKHPEVNWLSVFAGYLDILLLPCLRIIIDKRIVSRTLDRQNARAILWPDELKVGVFDAAP